MMRYLCLFFVLMGLAFASGATPDTLAVRKSGLTGAQAKQVLVLVLRHEGYDLKKRGMYIDGPFKIDPSIPSQRGYWEFGLTYDSPKFGASEVLDRFAVSRFTAEVWETNLCKRYDFPALTKLQTMVTQQTGKTRHDETDARRGLGCTDE